jgi:hypothetical protein
VKPVFEIVPEAIFFLETNLICEVSPDSFSFVFENDSQKKFHGLSAYQFSKGSDISRHVKQLFNEHPLLGKSYKKVFISWAGEECALLPGELYKPGENEMLLNTLHGDLEESAISTDVIADKNIYNVYRMPAALHKTLVDQFPLATFTHQNSTLIKQALTGEGMRIIFYSDRFTVAYTGEGKLKLINTFAYHSAADVVYHLQNIFKQFGLNNVQLKLGGMIDPSGELASELKHYFGTIIFEGFPEEYEYAAGLKSLPPHYFSHLFSLAQCV